MPTGKTLQAWLDAQGELERHGYKRVIDGNCVVAYRIARDQPRLDRTLPSHIQMEYRPDPTWPCFRFSAYKGAYLLAFGHELAHLAHVAENGIERTGK